MIRVKAMDSDRDTEWTRDRLMALADQLLVAQEELRAALAQEMHTELGSLLTGLAVDLSRINSGDEPGCTHELALDSSRALLRQAVVLKRSFIEKLYPSTLRLLGLGASLESLANEFSLCYGVTAVAVIVPPEPSIAEPVAIDLYRLAQAALDNVAGHANASEVRLDLAQEADDVVMSIRDNGGGFDAARCPQGEGLRLMSYRMARWGRKLHLSSTPGGGTTIVARVPKETALAGRRT
jgi:protein-histidine pros-kinase